MPTTRDVHVLLSNTWANVSMHLYNWSECIIFLQFRANEIWKKKEGAGWLMQSAFYDEEPTKE